MRTQNVPPGSSPLEPDLNSAAAEEDVPLQTASAESTTNTSPHHPGVAPHADLQSLEPTSLSHLPTLAQHHHHSTTEVVHETEATDKEEDDDDDMVDVEEGGAPLYTIDMEEMYDQPPGSPSPETLPIFDPADDSIDNIASPPFVSAAADPFTSPGIVESTQLPLEQDVDDQEVFVFGPEFGADEFEPHPFFLPNANPGILMPDNHNCLDFLRLWRWYKRQNQLKDITCTPHNEHSIREVKQPRVAYSDLQGDDYDLQGINWRHMGVTRSAARKCRVKTFRNYTNKPNSDAWYPHVPDKLLTRHENYFRFQSMDLRNDVRLLHFQLRNIMGCASRTAVYYPSITGTVRKLDPTTGVVETAMKFKTSEDAQVSTIAAAENMLVAGSFYGTYRYRPLEAEDESRCYDGKLTDHASGITNHVQVHSSRYSSTPVAAFASNDYGFRMVDLARNEMILDNMYDFALNCTALSPDKRLRAMIGDLQEVLITDAERGGILEKLEGHRDFGFACDWAPDGWTVATGNQDKSIRIWDARMWKNSRGESNVVSVIRTEMAGVRSLQFSPLGSGKRLLLAAEEADVVNIIDAQTFNGKQTIDIFGELAGVSFTSGGQEVVALSSDPVRGGVLRLSRCHDWEDNMDYTWDAGYDWLPTPHKLFDIAGSQMSLTQRQRQAAMCQDWLF